MHEFLDEIPDTGHVRMEGTDQYGHEVVHIIPLHDLRPHKPHECCWCVPEESPYEADVFYHEAADGRDAYIEGRRQPH